MARIRSIKPEIRTSDVVTAWPFELRYFWVLLWGYCDDFGRGRDRAELIRADMYPLDMERVSLDHIETWMQRLAADGVIDRYIVGGVGYFQIVNWAEHQKPQHPSKVAAIPCPHGEYVRGDCSKHSETSGDALMTGSGQSHETFMSDSGEALPRAGSREQLSGRGSASAPVDATPPPPQTDSPPPIGCARHPGGTDAPCRACGDARRSREDWERQQKAKPTPMPQMPDYCSKHPGYPTEPSGCDRCKLEAVEEAERARRDAEAFDEIAQRVPDVFADVEGVDHVVE